MAIAGSFRRTPTSASAKAEALTTVRSCLLVVLRELLPTQCVGRTGLQAIERKRDMSTVISRRDFVGVIPAIGLGAGALLGGSPSSVRAVDPPPADAGPYAGFPRQDQKLVQEVVGASHANEARVRELIELKPQLVNL